MDNEYTSIQIRIPTWSKLSRLKIRNRNANLDEVINELLKK